MKQQRVLVLKYRTSSDLRHPTVSRALETGWLKHYNNSALKTFIAAALSIRRLGGRDLNLMTERQLAQPNDEGRLYAQLDIAETARTVGLKPKMFLTSLRALERRGRLTLFCIDHSQPLGDYIVMLASVDTLFEFGA